MTDTSAARETLAALQCTLAAERADTHERLQRLEEGYKEERRNIFSDFNERTRHLVREIEVLSKAIATVESLSVPPPIFISGENT